MATSWKGIEQDLIQVAPVLGGLIGGPAGAAIGTVVSTALGTPNTPDAVQRALKADPEAAVKLQQAILDNKVQLQQLAITARQNELAAETANLSSVNKTMQSETASDHWPTYTWRPFIGFIFGLMVFGDYFIIPVCHQWFPAMIVPTVPENVWLSLGAVLGVASFWRGKMQAAPNVPSDNRG